MKLFLLECQYYKMQKSSWYYIYYYFYYLYLYLFIIYSY
jgi:hypothetical protein